jgi:hypothetical protein
MGKSKPRLMLIMLFRTRATSGRSGLANYKVCADHIMPASRMKKAAIAFGRRLAPMVGQYEINQTTLFVDGGRGRFDLWSLGRPVPARRTIESAIGCNHTRGRFY